MTTRILALAGPQCVTNLEINGENKITGSHVFCDCFINQRGLQPGK